MMEIPKVIKEIIKKGVIVEIGYSEDYGFHFNMGTHAKSHLHLVPMKDKNFFKAYMRYDDKCVVESNIESIASCVKDCMYGRDHVDSSWVKIMVECGLATSETKTVTKVNF